MATTHLRLSKIRKQLTADIATATAAVAATQTNVTYAGGILTTGTSSTGAIPAAGALQVLARYKKWLDGTNRGSRAS